MTPVDLAMIDVKNDIQALEARLDDRLTQQDNAIRDIYVAVIGVLGVIVSGLVGGIVYLLVT